MKDITFSETGFPVIRLFQGDRRPLLGDVRYAGECYPDSNVVHITNNIPIIPIDSEEYETWDGMVWVTLKEMNAFYKWLGIHKK